ETPLHYAAAYGDEEMIRAMLLAGADRKAPNTHGETPLEYAGRHHRPRSIRDLLKELLPQDGSDKQCLSRRRPPARGANRAEPARGGRAPGRTADPPAL